MPISAGGVAEASPPNLCAVDCLEFANVVDQNPACLVQLVQKQQATDLSRMEQSESEFAFPHLYFSTNYAAMQFTIANTLAVWLILNFCIPTTRSAEPASKDKLEFAQSVAPILEQHCIRCHYPGLEKGDVSLATAGDLTELEYILPGKAEESYLIELVSEHGGQAPQMPKDAEPLSNDEVDILRRWINEGATWPENVVVEQSSKAGGDWWSLQPVVAVSPPELPSVPENFARWKTQDLDRFVYDRLQREGLTPNQRADRRTLIRRLTYDLTGLPPTPNEVDAFLEDDSEQAYESLVDRLLASPEYGRRWGRHWLDVVRFGESTGYEQNIIVDDAWPFRDYVIDSINNDKPFDELIREHIAGDVLDPNNPDAIIGSAFLVNGPYDTVGNQDAAQAAQIRANTIDEMIRTTSEAFLGLTVGCARCHDHKFDPIKQKDYYRLYATFAGMKHGSNTWATPTQIKERNDALEPLEEQLSSLESEQDKLNGAIRERANESLEEYSTAWTRPAIDRQETVDEFPPVEIKYLKLICEGRDDSLSAKSNFEVDELEIWSVGDIPRNVALASNGATASGPSRSIEDFPGAYGPHLAIDGKHGARFIAASNYLQIELAEPTLVNRVVFSSAKGEELPQQPKFRFISEYRIEVSLDGKEFSEIATGADRKPINDEHALHRAIKLATTADDQTSLAELRKKIQRIKKDIASIPSLPKAYIGSRDSKAAEGPFHVFLGGSPAKLGDSVLPGSLSFLDTGLPIYELEDLASEGERRAALANWIASPNNPLTTRVFANRLWHYHFGKGLLKTPSDFGYMGGQPSHPQLLDWLATQLVSNGWRMKPMHKLIVMSETYRQSSEGNEAAAAIDADATLLWRFPARRLSAEEIRDSMLAVAGVLQQSGGGPGFRLYKYLRDNVATYVPLDDHGADTYRRGVYHQNARACRTDLMTDFDFPDCAFSTARRANTTTPLQALTSLNHSFAIDMSQALAKRLDSEFEQGSETEKIERAFKLCFGRTPDQRELEESVELVAATQLSSLTRALLNASEFIFVR